MSARPFTTGIAALPPTATTALGTEASAAKPIACNRTNGSHAAAERTARALRELGHYALASVSPPPAGRPPPPPSPAVTRLIARPLSSPVLSS